MTLLIRLFLLSLIFFGPPPKKIVFFGGGGSGWPMILRLSCEKASEVILFWTMRISRYTKFSSFGFNFTKYFVKSSHFL